MKYSIEMLNVVKNDDQDSINTLFEAYTDGDNFVCDYSESFKIVEEDVISVAEKILQKMADDEVVDSIANYVILPKE